MKKILFIPDFHSPYEDKRAFNLMLKAAKGFKPDIIVILGDAADFYAVSAHDKDPLRKFSFEYECSETVLRLDEIRRINKNARKIFIAGNHEHRLHRYLATQAKELYGVVRLEKLLQLKELGFEYVPYKDFIKLGKLYITHDTNRSGKHCAQQSLMDTQHNIVIGHAHRVSYCVEGDALGTPHIAACFGWLGDKEACDYMHKIRANRDWALGFGIGYLEPGGNVHLQPVPIVKYKCVVEGRLYSSR